MNLPFAQITPNIKPPIANENSLAKLRPIRAQEGGLAPIYVAIVPRLTSAFGIGVESWVLLLVAVEIRVRYGA